MLSMDELIQQLEYIRDAASDVKKVPGARTIYLGAGWFSDRQIETLLAAYKALNNNPTISYVHVPLLNQFGGQAFDENGDFNPDYTWAVATYNADITAIQNTDVTLGVITAGNEDSGTAFELGYAAALGRPSVAFFDGDWEAKPINLMPAIGPASYVRSTDELATFNFMSIATRIYEGKII